MGSTMATYGGQNVGAGKLERILQGLKSCILLGAVYSVMAFLIAFFLGEPLAAMFVKEQDLQILSDVRLYLVISTLFFFPLALVNIARGFTGAVLVPQFGFTAACLGSPIAWLCADAFLIPAFLHVYRRLKVQLPPAKAPDR